MSLSISTKPNSIAIFTPLPPKESGIAEHSIKIISELIKFYKCDLFVDENYTPDLSGIKSSLGIYLNVYSYPKFKHKFEKNNYEAVIYQLGNSHHHSYMIKTMQKHPGIIVLHDLNLHTFTRLSYSKTVNDYTNILGHDYLNPKKILKRISKKQLDFYSVIINRYYLRKYKQIVVHNKLSYDYLMREGYRNVHLLKLPVALPMLNKSKTNDNTIIISSFGGAHPIKGIEECIRAVSSIVNKSTKIIKYNIVGRCSNEYRVRLYKIIDDLNLGENVTIFGHVSNIDYTRHLLNTDICLNVRKNTNGESSAALLDSLSYGIPTIVSHLDSFSEFPDNVVIKVNNQYLEKDLIKQLNLLINDKHTQRRYSISAREYIKHNNSINIYTNHIKDLISKNSEIIEIKDKDYKLKTIPNKEVIVKRRVKYKKTKEIKPIKKRKIKNIGQLN